jgi:agmatinase
MAFESFDPNAAASPDSGIYGLTTTAEVSRVVLIGVPWEATTSYRTGTARGPAAILAASRQVDLFDVETERPYASGICMLPEDAQMVAWAEEARALAEPIIELGGVPPSDPRLQPIDALSRALNERVHELASAWLARDKIVVVVGGDHSTPFGLLRAIAERHPGVGVLHFDAHADLRPAYEGFADSHASIMYNVAERLPGVARIVQVGIRDLGENEHDYAQQSGGRIVQFHDLALAKQRDRGASWQSQCDEIVARLPKSVYLSFDIDGLDPTLCPRTGTPVPGGLSFHQACGLFRTVVESRREIVGFDLNEVAPGPEGDEWDANVGARILYKMIGWTLRSRSQ